MWEQTLISEGRLLWKLCVHLTNCKVSCTHEYKKVKWQGYRRFSWKAVRGYGFCRSWFSKQGLFESRDFLIEFSQWRVLRWLNFSSFARKVYRLKILRRDAFQFKDLILKFLNSLMNVSGHWTACLQSHVSLSVLQPLSCGLTATVSEQAARCMTWPLTSFRSSLWSICIHNSRHFHMTFKSRVRGKNGISSCTTIFLITIDNPAKFPDVVLIDFSLLAFNKCRYSSVSFCFSSLYLNYFWIKVDLRLFHIP